MRLLRTRDWLIYAPLGWLPLELLLELLFEHHAGGPADYVLCAVFCISCPVVSGSVVERVNTMVLASTNTCSHPLIARNSLAVAIKIAVKDVPS